jgi:hypothetical protein
VGKGSHTKAKRKSTVRRAPGAASRFSPGQLAIDEIQLERELTEMAAEDLPTYGLAAHYLASSPYRDANQCLLACTILMLAMRTFGLEANLVAVEVEIPWAAGGRGIRYGSPTPGFDGPALRGHVALLAGDMFIDPTAAQFSEIRQNGGVRAVGGKLGNVASRVAVQGGRIQIKMPTGKAVTYVVHPVGSADGVGAQLISMQPDRMALPTAVSNLLTGFAVTLAHLRPQVVTPFPSLTRRIRESRGMTLRNQDGALEAVPLGGVAHDE